MMFANSKYKVQTISIILAAVILSISGLYSIYWKSLWQPPYDGVMWTTSMEGPVAEWIDPSGPAAHAGLQNGDRLISINGEKVQSSLSAEDYPWREDATSPLILKVKRGMEEKEILLLLERSDQKGGMYFFLAIAGFFTLLIATYLALKLKITRFVSLYFLLSAAIFILFVFSPTGRNSLGDKFIYVMDLFARIMLPALLLSFVIAFSRRVVRSRRVAISLSYIPSILIVLINAYFLILRGIYDFANPLKAFEVKDRMELLLLSLSFILALAILFKSYFKEESIYNKAQLKWLMYGIGLGFLPFSLIYGIPYALIGDVPPWTEFSAFPVIILPIAFSSALLKYRLMDLELYLKRGLFYLSLTFFTLGAFAAIAILVERLIRPFYDPGAYFFAAIAAILTAFLYQKLRKLTKFMIEKLFYREKYNFRKAVLSFIQELSQQPDVSSLTANFTNKLIETLNLKSCYLLLKNEEKNCYELFSKTGVKRLFIDAHSPIIGVLSKTNYFAMYQVDFNSDQKEFSGLMSLGVSYLFPMKVQNELTAVLAIGEKREGSPLNSEDLLLLSTLSGHAAPAIESARLFDEVSKKVSEINRLMKYNENILESSKIGIMVINASGRIMNWNRTLEDIYSSSKSDSVGKNMTEIFPAHLTRYVLDKVNAPLRGEDRAYRYTFINRMGRRIIANISISPLEQKKDTPNQFVVTFDDVTEQVKLEERLLRQERLASIGLLAAGVAHEVNTPLTGISSYVQMLLSEMDETDPRFSVLKKIESQSVRASSIANSLLKFSRGESSDLEQLNLNDILEDTLSLFESQILGKNIKIKKKLARDLPLISGNRNKLQQVFLNILMNSRDALPSEGQIKLESKFEDERIIVKIADNGIGIAKEDMIRIFDPFYTTKGKGKGTGLGLSISYGIIQEHHGEIYVESVPGQLTEFSVEFPVGKEAMLTA